MRQASKRIPDSAEKTVRDIRRNTRRHHSAEEKIRIVLEGLRGEVSIAELCRKEGINQNLYYRWSKEFLEAGKKRLAGDTAREATSDEVKELKAEEAKHFRWWGAARRRCSFRIPTLRFTREYINSGHRSTVAGPDVTRRRPPRVHCKSRYSFSS